MKWNRPRRLSLARQADGQSGEEGGRRKAEGGRSQQSEIPLPPLPLPPFVVRTPTATVTDLGTEFGVEVDKSGRTTSHVFRGRVEVRRGMSEREKTEAIQLAAGEGVCIERGASEAHRLKADPNRFVTALPRKNSRPHLIARYQFDTIIDGMVLRTPDSSGNHRSGTLLEITRADLVPGKIGNALQFNVADGRQGQRMLLPWTPVFDLVGNSFTIALWLNRRATGIEPYETILHKEAGPPITVTGGYVIDAESGYRQARISR